MMWAAFCCVRLHHIVGSLKCFPAARELCKDKQLSCTRDNGGGGVNTKFSLVGTPGLCSEVPHFPGVEPIQMGTITFGEQELSSVPFS